jgi:hypothetical protein
MATHSPASAGSALQRAASVCERCGRVRSNRQLGLFTLNASTRSDSTPTFESPETCPGSTCSPEGSPARISASQESGADSATRTDLTPDPAFSLSSFDFWRSLGLSGSSLRTSLVCYPMIPAEQWESFSPHWSNAGTASRGGFSTLAISESPNDAEECSLSDILQETSDVPRRFYLSRRACLGILRRAAKRGKKLPAHLEAALRAAASEPQTSTTTGRSWSPMLSRLAAMTRAKTGRDRERRSSPRLSAVVAWLTRSDRPGRAATTFPSSLSTRRKSLTPRTGVTLNQEDRHPRSPEEHTLQPSISAKDQTSARWERSGEGTVTKLEASRSSVRRLTPLECERLQGFPDHWTCVRSARKGQTVHVTPLSETPWLSPSSSGFSDESQSRAEETK